LRKACETVAKVLQAPHKATRAKSKSYVFQLQEAAMMATISSYAAITANLDRSLSRVAAEPANARASSEYLNRIGNIKTVDAFLKDDRVFTYALKAHGLEDMAYAKAFIRKVLEEGVDGRTTFANQLADPRYKELAETFNFKRYGETATVFARAQTGTVAKFNRQSLELEAGQENEGVRLALYFQRQAPKAENTFDLIADPALARVIQIAAGLPQSMGVLDIDKQAAMIEWRVDFASLKQPEKLARLIERFTALWDIEQPQQSITNDTAILFADNSIIGPDGDMLLALQSWRAGR
jgi:hypothetical protein